jgi:6-pyruvoyltetrahydropterin/6-carboxytetrahydropterin synthase
MHPKEARFALTRAYRFAASHFYYDAGLSQAENERLFGKCANRQGHGHDYRFEVTVRGPLQERTGMVIDMAVLDGLVEEHVRQVLDHRNLNLEVPFFAERQPTTENLALYVWLELAPRLPAGELARVRVYESDDLFADCEDPPVGLR